MIAVYPGKSGWDQAISQKVVWMVGAGQQSASLTLNPPDLGPLKVVINVHNDQADTTFISDNDEVRKALESGMSNLRDKMSESGIQLGQANVSTSQQSQQEFQQAAQNRLFQGVKGQASAEVMESGSQAKVTVRVSDGLVDTFA
jgi:flagellar hook-length control protein FliK